MVYYVTYKNKYFKIVHYIAENRCYQRKVVPPVNLVIPSIVDKRISEGELRAVTIWLNKLSVEHE